MTKPIVKVVMAVMLASAEFVTAQTQEYPLYSCVDSVPMSTPAERFIDHGDGTLTDLKYKLMWAKCPDGRTGDTCDQGPFIINLLPNVLAAAGESNLGEHNDWRLPNVIELESILERACNFPSVNLAVFPNPYSSIGSRIYLSNSPIVGGENRFISVDFLVSPSKRRDATAGLARFVRTLSQ